jgi:hypothetical protein
MDDEAKQLLREIRDIGLRNEASIKRDMGFRKQVLTAIFIFVLIAFGALAYLMNFLNSLDPMPKGREHVAPHGNTAM